MDRGGQAQARGVEELRGEHLGRKLQRLEGRIVQRMKEPVNPEKDSPSQPRNLPARGRPARRKPPDPWENGGIKANAVELAITLLAEGISGEITNCLPLLYGQFNGPLRLGYLPSTFRAGSVRRFFLVISDRARYATCRQNETRTERAPRTRPVRSSIPVSGFSEGGTCR